MSLPIPSIKRLCRVYELLSELRRANRSSISSTEIGQSLQIKAHTVRKDINLLGKIGPSRSGYPVDKLIKLIQERLQLCEKKGLCVVGLGPVGQIVLRYYDFLKDSYPLLAGFDQSINRLETINTTVPLYPFHAITEVVQAEDISLAILTTVRELAQKATERLVRGGVRGIINLTGTLLHSNRQDVWIKSIDLREELRILTACLTKGRSGRLE